MAAMKHNFDACLSEVLALEPDTPDSHMGVTLATWRFWLGQVAGETATLADVMALTREDVEPLYRVFWRGCSADWLPEGVDLVVFDMAVNHSVPVANDWLKEALGVVEPTEAGKVGPVTLKAAAIDPAQAPYNICYTRVMKAPADVNRCYLLLVATREMLRQKAA